MTKIDISVILPVYNVEPYLRCCLDSIVAQHLPSFEVLMIDDGSSDGSGAVCDEYASRYASFRSIRRSHCSVSSTRNYGIKEARGEYVIFVDSDDFLVPDTIASLHALAVANRLDVLAYRSVNVPQEAVAAPALPAATAEPLSICNGVEYVARYNFPTVCWVYLVRRDHLLTNSIVFPEGHFIEDAGFSLRVYLKASRLAQTDVIAYCYRARHDSIMRKKSLDHQLTLLPDYLYAAADIDSIMREHDGEMSPDCRERCRTRRDSFVYNGAGRAFRLGRVKEYVASAREQGLYPFKRMNTLDYPGATITIISWLINRPLLWRALSRIYRTFKSFHK